MSAEEEEKFQLTNSFWICDKLFDVGDKKVRDHCHIKYRGAAHFSCTANMKLSKKVPVIFHISFERLWQSFDNKRGGYI